MLKFRFGIPALVCLQVWGKPLWSKRPVKLWCHLEWELKGFTQRKSGIEVVESALMWSQWVERGDICPESGNAIGSLFQSTRVLSLCGHVLPDIVLIYRDAASPAHGGREYTVGQYVVDLPSFENLALPLFSNVRTRL